MKKMLLSITMVCASFAMNAQIIVAGISPAPIVQNYDFTWADDWGQTPNFNIPNTYIQGDLVLVNDGAAGNSPITGYPNSRYGCSASTAGQYAGKIAVVYRYDGSGTSSPTYCDFSAKVLNAQNAGAIGVIMINREAGVVGMAGGTTGSSVTIPVVMLSLSDGELLTNQMANGAVTMFIGNKAGILTNDLASYQQVSLLPKYYGVSSTLSQSGSEFNFDPGLRVYNFGTANQDNITVNAKITNPSGATIYDEDLGPFSLAGVTGVTIDSMDIDPTSTDLFPTFSQLSYPNGEYTLTYSIVNADNADDDNTDNIMVSKFNVNAYVHSYARLDANMKPKATSFNRAADGSSFTQCIPFRDANASRIGIDGLYFQATTASTITPSLEGSAFQLTAYKWNDDFVDMNDTGFDFTALEDFAYGEYTFGLDEEETAVYGKFDNQFLLENNQRYLFCVTGTGDSLYLGFDTDSRYNWNVGVYAQPIIVMSNGTDYFTGFTGADNWAPSLALGIFPATELGIKETTSIEGRAFPNPANNVVTISVDYKGAAALTVTDVSGRNAFSKAINLESGKTDVDVSTLATGMYIFNVTFENGQTSQFNVAKK